MTYILSFKNTSNAIKAEKTLLNEDLKVKVMPLPSKIAAGCGICLRIQDEDIKKSIEVLKENEVEYSNIYKKDDKNFDKLKEGDLDG